MVDDALLDRRSSDTLLYGSDATPAIVAVETAGPDRVALFRRRADGGLERQYDALQPWLLASRAEPWLALRPRPEIEPLAGELTYRFLIRFSSWSHYAGAVRAARETGEQVLDLASPVEQYLMLTGRTLFKGMTFDQLRRLQLDIETLGLDARHPESQLVAIALRGSDGREEVISRLSSEAELLGRLGDLVTEFDPDVIEGHNLFNFDLPFLVTRAERAGLELRWGRDGSPVRLGNSRQRFKAGPLTLPYKPAYIYGRHIIDTYQQIQRYDTAGHLMSYGLKSAVESLGLTRPNREFVPGDQIGAVWRHDPDRLLRYALDDVRDVDTISSLALPTEFYQTQLLPRSFQSVATGGPGGKINDLMLRAYLAARHSVPTPRPVQEYPGGYAEVLEIGAFAPVVKCDVESLYPSIMLREGITSSADTLNAYLPMLRTLTERRLVAKRRSRETAGAERALWEGLQSSFKVLINSFYGYLGFNAGLFNDYEAARRVTLYGQDIIRQTVQRLQEAGARPIEVDTDGVYFVPPPSVIGESVERAFVDAVGSGLPEGIRLGHDGRYRAMLSLKMKTYALLTADDRVILRGSSLRSRRMEPCFRAFLREAARGFMHDDRDAVRDAYFALGARIRARELAIDEFTQWSMLNEETLASHPRLKRLADRLGLIARGGDRIELYERQDGQLALKDEYARDESVPYLLRRLHDTATRFQDLFPTVAEFTAFFPPLSARTDLTAAREQEILVQTGLW